MDRPSTRIEQDDPSLILSRAHVRRATLLMRAPDGSSAFEFDFYFLHSQNGFRKIAQVQLTLTEHLPEGARHQIVQWCEEASIPTQTLMTLSNASLSDVSSQGQVSARGKSVAWNLRFSSSEPISEPLQEARALKVISSASRSIVFSGEIEWAGKKFSVDQWAGARLGHEGPFLGRSGARLWVSGVPGVSGASGLKDDRGKPSTGLLWASMAQLPVLGFMTTPRLTAVHFELEGKQYRSGTVWKMLRNHSKEVSEEGWEFRSDFGSASIQVDISTGARDFAVSTLEDTDGSTLERRCALRCPIRLVVYQGGKLHATLQGLAFYESFQKV